MHQFYTFTEDQIHTILFALLQLSMNLDQSDLIAEIKEQMAHNKMKTIAHNTKVAS
jgi:hypothetical protein